jgi:hypothetical protein
MASSRAVFAALSSTEALLFQSSFFSIAAICLASSSALVAFYHEKIAFFTGISDNRERFKNALSYESKFYIFLQITASTIAIVFLGITIFSQSL